MSVHNQCASLIVSVALFAFAMLVGSPAQAQLTWDANGGGAGQTNGAGAWLGANLWWNGATNQTWVSGSDAIFAGTATAGGAVTLASPTTANTLTFSPLFTGTYTLGTASQALTINNGITKNASSGAVTISSPITLGGAQTWTNNSATTLTLNGAISNAGFDLTVDGSGTTSFGAAMAAGAGGGLIKNGSGRLTTFNAATSFTGPVTVNGGVLQYGDQIAWLTTGNITLNGGVIEARWNENITKTQGSGAGQIRILGGESGFSENGSAGVNWNIGAITWGSATFNPSKFVLQTSASQSGSSVTMNSASTFNLGGATRTILVNSGSVGNASATIAGGISNGGLIKEGAGLLVLGATNSYAAGTTISAGTLRFDTRLSMPATGTVTVADGATLGVTVAGSGTTWGSGTGVAGIAGLTSTGNGGEGYGGQAGAVVNFDGNSILNLNVTGNVTESNAIGNGTATSIGLIKTGGSTLTLSGNNSFSGGTQFVGGTLSAGHLNAIGTTGDLTFRGGTLQYTAASAGNDYGSRIKNSTSAIALDTNSQNVALSGIVNTNTGGLTKSGAGTLTLTGNNTFTGTTTINAGAIVLNNDGDVTGSAITFAGSNTGLTITGGSGVISTWNLNGGDLNATGTPITNVQMLIDGAGTAGSARVINVGILAFGRSLTNSAITLTNGGQMNVNGEIRIANPYYEGTIGNTDLIIGGGAVTSTFTGNNQAFYIGYNERNPSKNNDVTVNSRGVLTGIGNMFVGNTANGADQGDSTNNKLTVDGTGTASMASVTVGYAQIGVDAANANVVQVTNGGTLTTSGTNYIGRATAASATANANTATVTGTGSTWNAGTSQNVFVGFTANATATSNNNIFTVGSGGTVTGINGLTLGSGAGTETGNELVMLGGGSLTATSITVSASNTLRFGNGGTTSALSLTGDITNNGSMVFNLSDTITQGTNFDNAFGGTGSVTQNGSGTLVLNGNNTYAGGTNINAGILSLGIGQSGTGGPLGGSGTVATVGTIVFGGGTLQFSASNNVNYSSRFSQGANQAYNLDTNGVDVIWSVGRTPSSGGTMTKSGAGTLSVTTAANGWTGATTITGGILNFNSLAAGGANSSIGAGSVANTDLVLNGGTLQYNGSAAQTTNRLFTVGASGGSIDASGSNNANPLTFTGTGNLGASTTGNRTLTLTGLNTGDNSIAGNIVDPSSGATSLSKTGGGKWILSGGNTYAGPTSITDGTLLVNGTHTGGGLYTVGSGAGPDTLGGSGIINAAVDILAGGGVLAPGTSPGILTINGNVSIAGDLSSELTGVTVGSNYDQLRLQTTGGPYNVTLGGTLTPLFSGSGWATPSTQLWIVNNESVGNLIGTFSNYPTNGQLVTNYDLQPWYIYYNANFASLATTGGNDVLLTPFVVPEPSSLAMLAFGMIAFMFFRRK